VPPGGQTAGVDTTHQHSTAPLLEKEKATQPILTHEPAPPTPAVSEPPPTPRPVFVDVRSPTPSPMMGLPSPPPQRSGRASQPPVRLIGSGYVAEKESSVAASNTYCETLAYMVEVCLVINKIPTQEEKECAYRSFLDYNDSTCRVLNRHAHMWPPNLVDLRTFDEVVWSATYPSETDV